ncbi:DEAD/DEAH box helicase [Laceyella putida]|uniref:DEAD/DEAH box helicase n=1 Tax=Laceyella putida TaxID=110101 RepID=A0ABW2RQ10_9BACL
MSYPIGSRLHIRGEEWLIQGVQPTNTGAYAVRVIGLSETVRDYQATFLDCIDEVVEIRPEDVRFVTDESPNYRRSRLYLNALMMRTPIVGSEITTRKQAAMEDSDYQYVPAQLALEQVRPRFLIADGVGLGKTIEAGVLMSELIRRGRGRRILVVSARSMLEQLQKEMWTRFSIPLMRLDSLGIAKIRYNIPQNKNPFHYYDKVIISIDTLKNDELYRRYLENCYWDIVMIDECHNVANANTDRNKLATLLADRCHSLILLSATPHNGKPESFATLLRMLDPTAVADPEKVTKEDIQHLVVRRFKKDVQAQTTNFYKVNDLPVPCEASKEETDILCDLGSTLLHTIQSKSPKRDALFQVTLLKSFLSSSVALSETLKQRIHQLERQLEKQGNSSNKETLQRDLHKLQLVKDKVDAIPIVKSSKFQTLCNMLREWGWDGTRSSERVIIFSERIATLEALQKALMKEFGIPEKEDEKVIELFTAKMPDHEQARVVREFNEEESPMRILLCSDIASEGVNLHHRCHHLIHFDIPWSFIRLQQRNGRIDRFGQTQTPEIRYIVLKSDEAKAETHVIEKLVEKAQSIEQSLGDPSSILRLFDPDEEEDHIQNRLAEGKKVDEIFEEDDEDDWDLDFFDPIPRLVEAKAIRMKEPTRLYHDWLLQLEHLQQELGEDEQRALADLRGRRKQSVKIRVDHEQKRVFISGIKDLKKRLESLPPEARPREGEELRCTTDTKRVMRAIANATRDGEWPQEHLLWENHPVADWIADRSLALFPSKQAPSLKLSTVPIGTTYYLVQANVLTESGHPALAEWLVVRVDAKGMKAIPLSEVPELLKADQWINDGSYHPEVEDQNLTSVVAYAEQYVQDRLQQVQTELQERINREKERLTAWYQESLKPIKDKQLSLFEESHQAAQLRRLVKKEHQIQSTYESTVAGLESMLKVKGEPVLRICARFQGSEEMNR